MTDPKMVACYKTIPAAQRFMLALRTDQGIPMKASTLGAIISNTAVLLKSGDDEVFVTGMSISDERGIEVQFSVLPKADEDPTP